jgi:hypothetical protein
MDENKQLCRIIDRQTNSFPDSTVKLADAIKGIMDRRISPCQKRFAVVAEAWERILPQSLRSHCRMTDIAGGTIKVKVDSPVYLYELRLCEKPVLEQLQQDCPRAKIRKIQFTVG